MKSGVLTTADQDQRRTPYRQPQRKSSSDPAGISRLVVFKSRRATGRARPSGSTDSGTAVIGSSPSPEGSCREGITVPNIDRNRRAFLANSFSLAAGAGIMALGLPRAPAYAQTPPKPIRRSERYDDSFITERKPFKWPKT